MISLYQFLSGIAMLGAWVSGIHFLRFWVKTRDRLFFMFGIAFWLMSLERLVLAFTTDPGVEDHSYVYLIRLAAFLVILTAIIDKNRHNSQMK